VTLLFLLPSIVISNIVFFNLFGHSFYGLLFWADLLLLIRSYIQLLPAALRQIRVPLRRNVDIAQ
jgi:hypothetical protein